MTYITNMWFKFITNIFKISIMINHTFDLFDLLMSIPSETSIFSYCSIFITHTNIHVNKLVDNTCCLLKKQI